MRSSSKNNQTCATVIDFGALALCGKAPQREPTWSQTPSQIDPSSAQEHGFVARAAGETLFFLSSNAWICGQGSRGNIVLPSKAWFCGHGSSRSMVLWPGNTKARRKLAESSPKAPRPGSKFIFRTVSTFVFTVLKLLKTHINLLLYKCQNSVLNVF